MWDCYWNHDTESGLIRRNHITSEKGKNPKNKAWGEVKAVNKAEVLRTGTLDWIKRLILSRSFSSTTTSVSPDCSLLSWDNKTAFAIYKYGCTLQNNSLFQSPILSWQFLKFCSAFALPLNINWTFLKKYTQWFKSYLPAVLFWVPLHLGTVRSTTFSTDFICILLASPLLDWLDL